MKRHRRGFTLAELLVSMSITAVIGASVAGMSVALSSAYANSQGVYENIQTGRSIMMRIQRELNRARLVAFADQGMLVFWSRDANNDGRINISELVVISHDDTTGALTSRQVVFPDTMNPAEREALDNPIDLVEGMSADIAGTIDRNANGAERILGDCVTAFEVSALPACPMARLVRLKITIEQDGKALTVRSAASLRADKTAEVQTSDGVYVLAAETGTN